MLSSILLVLLTILLPSIADAATYYVGTSGSDNNAGTSGSRFRSIQKCVDVVVAGDTCLVGDGTYTRTDGSFSNTSAVANITSTYSPNGNAGSPITLKSENYLGAVITVPGANATNAGFYVNRQYYVIEGFEITGGTGTGASAANHGIFFESGATGGTARRNWIHGIAEGLCYDTSFGNTGVYVRPTATDVTIEYNRLNTIGRLRLNESGCGFNKFQHDHATYLEATTNTIFRYNLCYDSNRGFCLHVFKSGGTTTNLKVYHNTFAGKSPTGAPFGQIMLGTVMTTAEIKNNISYDAPNGSPGGSNGWMIDYLTGVTATNLDISYNLSDSTDADLQNPSRKPSSGVTNTNNVVGTSPGFVNAGSNDYTLAAGSAALGETNPGAILTGYTYNGSGPTRGAFDPPRFTSCVIENGDASTIRVTFTNNLNPPLLPAASPGTFTARKAGVADTVTASTRTGTNRVDLTVQNAYANGNSADISWASGNVTDSALIGGSLNQKYVTVLSQQACTNNVGAAAAYIVTQAAFEFHSLRGTEAAPVGTPYATAPENTHIQVRVGGSVRLRLALTCTTADCAPLAFFPYYACAACTSAGTYTLVPDSFATNEDIAFCGSGPDPDIPTSGTPTTDQLSTSGTFVAGALVRHSAAIPTVDMAQNGKTELEYCFAFDTDAVAARTYDIHVRKQDGTDLDAYTVTPRMTIVAPSGGMGF